MLVADARRPSVAMKRLLLALAACSSSTTAPIPALSPPPLTGPHGTVTKRRFHTAALGVDKTYYVYLPVGYDADQTRYPVFYYLHGLGGDEHVWVQGAHLDQAADALGLSAIVVMPDGDDGFYADAVAPVDYAACMKDGTGLLLHQHRATSCVHARNYETYITKDLVAEVDAKYRTIATREGRGLAGMSMGGFGALELAMRHPDEFSVAASHSGVDALLYAGPHPYGTGIVTLITDTSTWGHTADAVTDRFGEWVRGIFGPDLANWKDHDPAVLATKLAPGQLALYLDCGTEDVFGLDAEAEYLHGILDDHKLEHVYFIGHGGHDFKFWIARLPKSLAFLRDHLAKPR
jgi:S-formylglutathione hydrolase FrmB